MALDATHQPTARLERKASVLSTRRALPAGRDARPRRAVLPAGRGTGLRHRRPRRDGAGDLGWLALRCAGRPRRTPELPRRGAVCAGTLRGGSHARPGRDEAPDAGGDRAWCRTLSSLTPSLALTSQLQPVAELLDLLQDVEPTPEARPELRTTLACVGKRLVDIPAEADRRRYVVGVAFNARIVALAREWDLEVR
jgi:hypothetical protein